MIVKKGPFVSSVDTYAQLWTDIGVMALAKYVHYAQGNNCAMIVKRTFCVERGYIRATMDRYWRDALAKKYVRYAQ